MPPTSTPSGPGFAPSPRWRPSGRGWRSSSGPEGDQPDARRPLSVGDRRAGGRPDRLADHRAGRLDDGTDDGAPPLNGGAESTIGANLPWAGFKAGAHLSTRSCRKRRPRVRNRSECRLRQDHASAETHAGRGSVRESSRRRGDLHIQGNRRNTPSAPTAKRWTSDRRTEPLGGDPASGTAGASDRRATSPRSGEGLPPGGSGTASLDPIDPFDDL